jgi:hypothetical protein
LDWQRQTTLSQYARPPELAFAGVSDAETASASIAATVRRRMFILPDQIGAHPPTLARVNQSEPADQPDVGAIVLLTFATAIDDPARFKSSKQVGAYFGLTPSKDQQWRASW